MSAPATDFKVLVYINGIQFYPQSVSYGAQIGGFHTFSVAMPAVPQWKVLPPRSHAVVFFVDPVSHSWRMLCEGSYRGYTKSRTGEGTRTLNLNFQGLHAQWKKIQYSNFAGVFNSTVKGGGDDISNLQLRAKANGQNVIVADPNARKEFSIIALNEILFSMTSTTARLSGFFPRLIERIVQQTPVDSYYMYQRGWLRKLFCLQDDNIGSVVDVKMQYSIVKDSLNALGISPNTTLAHIIGQYEAVGYYQHLPIPAPPLYRATKDAKGNRTSQQIIPELMFSPHLYHTVPPACNVIFRDQITSDNVTRDFQAEATRVVTQLQTFPATLELPKYYLANTTGGADPIRELSNTTLPAGAGMTHDFLSLEELNKGVISQVMPLPYEKIAVPRDEENQPTLEAYIDQATRHHLEIARSEAHQTSLQLVFNPYIVPGYSTLVEDDTGPYFGLVQSIQHHLPATGAPSTSITITHVRDAFVDSAGNRSPRLPTWLNGKFYPQNIADTYSAIFGKNARRSAHAAMVPDSALPTRADQDEAAGSVAYYAEPVANLDELAALVVPTPSYSLQDGVVASRGLFHSEEETIAGQLRETGVMVHEEMLRFQFRSGVSLEEYVRFHSLEVPGGVNAEVNNPNIEPPRTLDDYQAKRGGHGLFGAPLGLRYLGGNPQRTRTVAQVEDPQNGKRFGLYELVDRNAPQVTTDVSDTDGDATTSTRGLISDERQRIADMIRTQIQKGSSDR